MKKLLTLIAIALAVVVSSCSKFDDSAIWDKLNEHEQTLNDHEKRIAALEELCKQMNTNINALQTLVEALEKRDYITNVSPVREDGVVVGYTISFASSDTITIYNGKDGSDGTGGYTPQIGVKKDADGLYYWTLDGEWLLDDSGNKIKAVGEDGRDGQDGTDGTNGSNGSNGQDGQDGEDGTDGRDGVDGITPRLKIENDYWYVSYDEGATWIELGRATGEDGADGSDGSDGDSIFTSVTQDDEYVYFHLTDGSVIKIPLATQDSKIISFADKDVKRVCVGLWDFDGDTELSYEEAANVDTIGNVFSQNTDIEYFNEFKYFTSVPSIDADAFKGCVNLKTLGIPSSITFIDASAFVGCSSLYQVKFEKDSKLTVLEGKFSESSDSYSGVFANCTSLKYVNIPSSVTEIKAGAFQNCKNLVEVKFEDSSSLRTIGGGHNMYTKTSAGSTSYYIARYGAFAFCTSLREIEIPSSVETIEECAFIGCTNLSSVNFEQDSRLTHLKGGYAYKKYGSKIYYEAKSTFGCFQDCVSLLSICIPSNVEVIDACVFQNCSSLASVTFEPNSKLREFGDGCSGGTYYTFITGAFAKCTSLTSITIPASVEKIGIGTFNLCESLTSVYFEDNSQLTTIGGAKGSIDSYEPNSQGTKEYGAFSYCMSLTSITIPSNVTNIGAVAFSNCSALMDVYCRAVDVPTIKSNTFTGIPNAHRFYVPQSSLEAYKSASNWSAYADSIVGYAF